MIEKPDNEVTKAAYLKAVRTAVRLKYSLMADAELNKALPRAEKMVEEALRSGESKEITVGKIVDAI